MCMHVRSGNVYVDWTIQKNFIAFLKAQYQLVIKLYPLFVETHLHVKGYQFARQQFRSTFSDDAGVKEVCKPKNKNDLNKKKKLHCLRSLPCNMYTSLSSSICSKSVHKTQLTYRYSYIQHRLEWGFRAGEYTNCKPCSIQEL